MPAEEWQSKVFRWIVVAMGVVSLLFLIELASAEVSTEPSNASTDAATQERIEELIDQLRDADTPSYSSQLSSYFCNRAE